MQEKLENEIAFRGHVSRLAEISEHFLCISYFEIKHSSVLLVHLALEMHAQTHFDPFPKNTKSFCIKNDYPFCKR